MDSRQLPEQITSLEHLYPKTGLSFGSKLDHFGIVHIGEFIFNVKFGHFDAVTNNN